MCMNNERRRTWGYAAAENVLLNKKPTNWWGKAKRRATQFYNLGRRSANSMCYYSLLAILHQTVTEMRLYA